MNKALEDMLRPYNPLWNEEFFMQLISQLQANKN
jgi:hypothetical protein